MKINKLLIILTTTTFCFSSELNRKKPSMMPSVSGNIPGEYTITNVTKDNPSKVKRISFFYGGFNDYFAFPWRENIQDYKFSKEAIFKFPSKLEEIYTSYKVPENIWVTPLSHCN